MKTFYAFILALLPGLASQLLAQSVVPQRLNYQAIARNVSGQPLANQNISVRFSITSGSPDGATDYRETHAVATNAFGLFTLQIGAGTPAQGNMAAIDWSNASKWLRVEIDPAGGTAYQLLGASEFVSVPYALEALRTTEPPDLSLNDLNNVNAGNAQTGQVLQWNGVSWAPADLPPNTGNQTLSIAGNQLSISNGNTVTLPAAPAYSAGTGISIAGNVITNAGDTNPNDDLTTITNHGGDLTGAYNNLQISPETVGSVEIADGSITADDLQPGAFPPSVLGPDGAQAGQVLTWNGSAWVPAGLPPGAVYSAGNGIAIAANVISNTGDLNPNDDLRLASIFSGDVTGLYNNLQIAPGAVGSVEIADGSISAADLQPGAFQPNTLGQGGAQNGQILTWDGNAWSPANPATYTAGPGIFFLGNQIRAADTSANNELQTLALNGNELSLSLGGGTVALPTGPTYTAGSGISMSGNVISNTGDTNPNDDLTTTTNHGGDVTGLYNNLQIAPGAVGSVEIADGSINAADLQPGAFQPNTLGQGGAQNGQILTWDGNAWSPADPVTYTAGNGISIAGNVIANTGDTNPNDDLTTVTNHGGDITGPYNDLQIAPGAVGSVEITDGSISAADLQPGAFQPNTLGQGGAQNGQVLTWDGNLWSPATPTTYTAGPGIFFVGNQIFALDTTQTNELQTLSLSGNQLTLSLGGGTVTLPTGPTYSAGTGISISGNVITNTGDTNPNDDLTITTTHGGDVTGLYNNLQIASNAVGTAELVNGAVTGAKISTMGASNGQVLKWNGSTWSPGTDLQGGGLTLPYEGTCTTTGNAAAFRINNQPNQYGIYVRNTFPNAENDHAAIVGENLGNTAPPPPPAPEFPGYAIGVYGRANETNQFGIGVRGVGSNKGVWGTSSNGIGGEFSGNRALVTSGGAVGLNLISPNRTVHIKQSNISFAYSWLKL